jgi:hypothetical protein
MAQYKGDLPSYRYFGDDVARHLTQSTAMHEAAHAVLGKLADIDMDEIRVLLHFGSGPHEIGSEGWVELDYPGRRRAQEFSDQKMAGWLLACSGGQVGQAMWYAKTKPGYDFERATAEVESGACHDFGLFKRFAKDRPLMTWEQAQARARQILEAHWPYVEHNAGVLYRAGRMQGRKVTVK